ncbi:MAG TPA: DUF1648 domain-containing protein [Alcaligenes sp.]|nr:DUF1648 domain-containing protein [Alcaligenes sp.]HRL28178.1 DUF1648 domain-containing protein [Alcaligenes sp.]
MHLTLIPIFAAVMYVWWTHPALPQLIASHFTTQGVADGFMERDQYVTVMIALMILLPLGCALLGALFTKLPDQAIRIPRRSYWLNPERRQESLSYLSNWLQSLSLLLIALLAFVHWSILRANQHTPSHLDTETLLLGSGLFVAALAAWVLILRRRFGLPAE